MCKYMHLYCYLPLVDTLLLLYTSTGVYQYEQVFIALTAEY